MAKQNETFFNMPYNSVSKIDALSSQVLSNTFWDELGSLHLIMAI